jgi:hypothetical protein
LSLTLTRRFLQATQPERDLACRLRFRLETPFISDRSAGSPLILDDGVTTKIESSAFGIDMGNLSTDETKGIVCQDRKDKQ